MKKTEKAYYIQTDKSGNVRVIYEEAKCPAELRGKLTKVTEIPEKPEDDIQILYYDKKTGLKWKKHTPAALAKEQLAMALDIFESNATISKELRKAATEFRAKIKLRKSQRVLKPLPIIPKAKTTVSPIQQKNKTPVKP